jgi:phospholipid/cholesterol/gamma-HCH transport system ATP-binding protein
MRLRAFFAIGNNSIFLDAETKAIIARGDPKELPAHSRNPMVHRFLSPEEERL